jgi:cytochrome P450
MPDIRKGPLQFFEDTAKIGDVVQFRFFVWKGILVNHPDAIRYILQDNNRNYSKHTFAYENLLPIVGKGLLTSDGEDWLSQRRLIQPAFHRQRIQDFSRVMVASADEMVDRWEQERFDQNPFNAAEEMMRLTLQIVGKALFSRDLSKEADSVGHAFNYANDYISRRMRSLFITPGRRQFNASLQELDRVVQEIIAERRAETGQRQDRSPDLLDMLVEARHEDSHQGMSDRQVRDEVMTLMLAGHETTATSLAWTWYLLAAHPQVEARLHEELDDVLCGRLPSMEDLPRLEYCRWVLQESMRLYPPAWIITRRAEAEDEIGGYRIPAKSMVEMSAYLIHRHPRYWEDPLKFDPERFTPQRSAGRPQYAYMPFGGGPRLCIGRDFAMTEALLVLALVGSRWKLVMEPGQTIVPDPLITLKPKGGIWMRLVARDASSP